MRQAIHQKTTIYKMVEIPKEDCDGRNCPCNHRKVIRKWVRLQDLPKRASRR
jgi:hypothetical protein